MIQDLWNMTLCCWVSSSCFTGSWCLHFQCHAMKAVKHSSLTNLWLLALWSSGPQYHTVWQVTTNILLLPKGYTEDGGSIVLKNSGIFVPEHTVACSYILGPYSTWQTVSVTSCHYSVMCVDGQLSGLCKYNKQADSKWQSKRLRWSRG
jgi:hypothetical protein